jgi:hypothetical protein
MDRSVGRTPERRLVLVQTRIIKSDALFVCMEGAIIRDDLPEPYTVIVNWPHGGDPEKTLAKFHEELVCKSHLLIDTAPQLTFFESEMERLKQKYREGIK